MRRMVIAQLSRLKNENPMTVPDTWEKVHLVPSDSRVLWDEVELLVGSSSSTTNYYVELRINSSTTPMRMEVIRNEGYHRVLAQAVFFPGDTIEIKADVAGHLVAHGHVQRALRE